MEESAGRQWFRAALLAGAAYLVIGLGTAPLAGAADADWLRFFWRLTAYIASGFVFAFHLAYEVRSLRSTPQRMAWHAAAGVAMGAFALALAAVFNDLRSPTGLRPQMALALIAWPLLTGIPAFVVAMAIGGALIVRRRLRER